MRPIIVGLLLLMLTSAAQLPDEPPVRHPHDQTEERLPNGKSQKDAMAKLAYEKSLEDARELVKLAQALQSELEKNEQYVVSVSAIRKTEEVEKLAKRIRGRLKSF